MFIFAQIMVWDHGNALAPLAVVETFDDERGKYVKFDQITIYDHALTLFYGMNAYIYAADHDEFLVLPQHMQIHDTLLHGTQLYVLTSIAPAGMACQYFFTGCMATGSPSHMLYRWAFPACTMTQVGAFMECVEQSTGSTDDVPKVCCFVCCVGNDQNHKHDVPSQVLHFVDDTHSASLHAAKGFTFPGKDSVQYVAHDCAFVAHMHLDQMQWS